MMTAAELGAIANELGRRAVMTPELGIDANPFMREQVVFEQLAELTARVDFLAGRAPGQAPPSDPAGALAVQAILEQLEVAKHARFRFQKIAEEHAAEVHRLTEKAAEKVAECLRLHREVVEARGVVRRLHEANFEPQILAALCREAARVVAAWDQDGGG